MKSRETVNKMNAILIFVYYVAIIHLLLSPIECVPLFDANNNVSHDVNEIKQGDKLNDFNSNDAIVANNGHEDDDWHSVQRRKRSGISDQRLAELETLLALKRLRDHQRRIKTPIAYGLFDPDKIGKRRRRSKQSMESLAM